MMFADKARKNQFPQSFFDDDIKDFQIYISGIWFLDDLGFDSVNPFFP